MAASSWLTKLGGAGHHAGRPFREEAGGIVERLSHVFDAEIGNPLKGDTVLPLHLLGQVHHGTGTLDQVESGAVGAADVVDAAIAGNGGDHLHAIFSK